MPRYFFNVVGSHELTDPSGIICRDVRSATAKAKRIAEGFAKRGTGYVVVFDSSNCEVARVVIPEVPQDRGNAEDSRASRLNPNF